MKRIVCIVLELIVVAVFISGSLDASDLSNSQLLKTYENHAFINENAKLLKPLPTIDDNPVVVCLAETTCIDTTRMLDSYFRADWMKLKSSESFNASNPISILLFSNAEVDNSKLGKVKLPPLKSDENTFSEGIRDCHVLSIYNETHVVKRVIVYVNKTLSEKLIISCVLIELARASGFVIEPKFLRQWGVGGVLTELSDAGFRTAMRGYSKLLALHFSRFTLPNMNKTEFEQAVSTSNAEVLTGEVSNE